MAQITVLVLVVAAPLCSALLRDKIVEDEIALGVGNQLPKAVVPIHYKLKLEPHFREGYFNGSVDIYIRCWESTNTIAVHSHHNLNVNYDEITLRSAVTGLNHRINSTFRNATSDALMIELQYKLLNGKTYKLHFTFNSNFSESDVGFFRGEDKTLPRDEKWYGVTIMFPSNARQVFPCFDDPSFKATFEISVAHSNYTTALSMMPLNHTEPAAKEGWVWDTFAVSPPIATYAVGIVVSQLNSHPLVNVSNKDGNLVLQFHHKGNHIWRPEMNFTSYIHHFIEKMIEYFDVAYPFPKIDIVYLPGNIDHQNSVGLFVGSPRYSDGGLQNMYGFFLHFFTQVSTPKGWTDFRILNLLSSYLFDVTWWKMLNKEFDLRLFLLNRFEYKYQRLSDCPSYSLIGGDWFFHMLNTSLTEKTMRKGLAKLIAPNNLKTYTVESLWTVLNEQGQSDGTFSGLVNISTIAKSWLRSKYQCYPVMTVTRNYDKNGATVKQHIFLNEVDHKTMQEEEEITWWLPLEYITSQQLDPSIHVIIWLSGKYLNFTNFPGADSFIIVNPKGSGYFLVNYDQHNWELISQYILSPSSQLAPETRVKLLNDAFLLASAGELNYTVPFNLTLSLRNENNPLMWQVLVKAVNFIRTYYLWSPIEDKINNYVRILMARMYDSISLTDDLLISSLPVFEETDAAVMREIEAEMCFIGYQPCVDKLNEKLLRKMSIFQIYDNVTNLHIACPAFISITAVDWLEGLFKLLSFLSTNTYEENKVYYKNFGRCPGYEETMKRVLDDIFEDNYHFTSTDWSRIVPLLLDSPVSHTISLNFVLDHLDRMNHTSPAFAQGWPYFLNSLFSRMTTYYSFRLLSEIREYYGYRISAHSLQSLNYSLKEARYAAAWYNKSATDIYNWLRNVPPQFNIRV